MKFCENCGTKLDDNALFCEECGVKQKIVKSSPVAEVNKLQSVIPYNENEGKQVDIAASKLSETCAPAKREIRSWLLILLLIVCSPLALFCILESINPFALCGVIIVAGIIVLAVMWKKRSWKTWLKIIVTVVYIITFWEILYL